MPKNPFASIAAANRMPSPPLVAMRILELVADENASLEDLTRIIASDPALTAKIMKYVNSPLLGLGFQGATLGEAISRIGMRCTQSIALSFSIVSQKHRAACPSFVFEGFWSESLACGVAARALARETGGWDPEEAFVTGLVARIGKLVFATAVPAEYEPVIGAAVHPELPLEARERLVLGADNLELGTSVLMHWKLPEGVWRPVGGIGTDPASELPLARPAAILLVADLIGRFVAVETERTGETLNAIIDAAATRLELTRETATELLVQIGSEWVEYGRMMDVSTGPPPDVAALERDAVELKDMLRMAAELEVRSLRKENEQLSALANRDRLTGLLNRGAFDEALGAALAEADRGGSDVALLLMDVDHFKAVNDTHGHPAGDEVLRWIARIISENLHGRGTAFRHGGEEFAVIAPACAPEAAAALAEQTRAALEAKTIQVEGAALRITMSVGVAGAKVGAGTSPAALIAIADQRLYAAKQAGRNRCHCGESVPVAERRQGGFLSRLGRMLPAGGR